MSNLLPCPFCGSHNVELDNGHSTVAVTCRDCDAQGGWAIRYGDGEERAIEAWNMRSNQCEELEQLCSDMYIQSTECQGHAHYPCLNYGYIIDRMVSLGLLERGK